MSATILDFPSIHKSLLQEITSMLYGKISLLATDDIFFAFSTDNGLTFSAPDNLSNNTGVSSDPQISSSGNNVYVVWEEFTPGTG